jgi:hypothetical protein
MLRLGGATLIASTNDVTRAIGTLAVEGGGPREPDAISALGKALEGCRESLREIALSAVVSGQLDRLVALIGDTSRQDRRPEVILIQYREFYNNLLTELASHVFFFVPSTRRVLYDDPAKWYGEPVTARFPEAARDFRDACQCFALSQWTATVFHAMRVLEHGLHDLARRLGVVFASGVELENWKNIIDQIEKKIREKEDLPKGQQKSEDLQFYSEAASQFRYFKNAWRNHVSHSRTDYDEQGATDVLNHVKYFMGALAK